MKNNNYDFIQKPIEFNKFTNKELLQYCLDATLYMPGTKDILEKLLNKKITGLTSMVMCFEDAIQESNLLKAEENVLKHLNSISDALEKNTIGYDDIGHITEHPANKENTDENKL